MRRPFVALRALRDGQLRARCGRNGSRTSDDPPPRRSRRPPSTTPRWNEGNIERSAVGVDGIRGIGGRDLDVRLVFGVETPGGTVTNGGRPRSRRDACRGLARARVWA